MKIVKEEYDKDKRIGICSINVYKNRIEISSWFVSSLYQHQNLGKKLLKEAVEEAILQCPKLEEIDYIWNGENSYVYEWMKKFDPICKCPINFLKKDEKDNWDSHLYKLDTLKFINYINNMELEKVKKIK